MKARTLAVLPLLLVGCTRGTTPEAKAYKACRSYMLDRAKFPHETSFRPDAYEVSISAEGARVVSWVEAPNLLGKAERADFACELTADLDVTSIKRTTFEPSATVPPPSAPALPEAGSGRTRRSGTRPTL